ncbi:MopE-related protein [Polyangium fumosum]|uniref:Uncharacterized protein n=1 Tax=Polyangium fumosum TaxID=889272 RepID=A0A4U1J7B8_9BACT|nr:MopE-related protein [Polyangium fumosum]TKD03209.1 hypothetical protein E8A74_27240 [Polyangium fumosum]
MSTFPSAPRASRFRGPARTLSFLSAFAFAGLSFAACSRTGIGTPPEESISGPGGAGGQGGVGGATSTSSIGGGGQGGVGGAPPCVVAQDCTDADPCTTDACVDGLCQHSPRDDDGDGFPPLGCSGTDCNDLNPKVFPGSPENCTDGADNDCNGVADCSDPACKLAPTCGCVPKPGGESCANGEDDDCDTIVDCFDSDCVGTPACGCKPSESLDCDNGFDDDCDGSIDCNDPDCFGSTACSCQAKSEVCSDGTDEDCDLLVDCADPDCFGIFPCACQPPGTPEVCVGGLDEDCDKLIDCADPNCIVSPACQSCTAEVCDDGKDNNCDNKIDCADPACFFAPNCAPKPEVCNNGLDDDNDTLVDCQDPDCANNPICILQQANCLSPKLIPGTGQYTGDTTGNVSETKGFCGGDAGEAVFYFVLNQPSRVHLDSIGTSFDSTLYVRTGKCNSGKEIGCDDDSAGVSWSARLDFTLLYPGTYYVFLDGYTVDPEQGANEGPFVLNVEIEPNPKEKCDDGKDNDGDVYVDCADPDCASFGICATCLNGGPGKPEFGTSACKNGLDDDCDGAADCADDDCSASDYYVTECCDGLDENGNQIPDDFNCRCASNADCSGGQICYTHTAFACGIPCTQYFGDVCPFVAAGSYCNPATNQCEF